MNRTTPLLAAAAATLAFAGFAAGQVLSDSFDRTTGNSDDTGAAFLSEIGSNDNAFGGTVVQDYAETPTRNSGGVNQTTDGSAAVIDFGAFSTSVDLAADPDVLAGGGYTVAFDFQRGQAGGFTGVFIGYDPSSVETQDGGAAFGPINGTNSATPGITDAAFLFQNQMGEGRVQYNSFVGGDDASDDVTINFDNVYSDGTGTLTGVHSALLTVNAPSGFGDGADGSVSISVDGNLVTTQDVTFDGNFGGVVGFSANQGNARIDNLVISAIPEPASLGLLGIGGLALLRRRG